MSSIHVGIIGVGNCASSLVQGVEYYRDAQRCAGLTHALCAGYRVADVVFSSAFDVDVCKIGQDLADAIWSGPNNALKFCDAKQQNVPIFEGILADGVSERCATRIDARGRSSVDEVAIHLRETGTEVLVSFLPVGSQLATEAYAEAALQARCAFINCIPATIARAPSWETRFKEAGVPLLGDDLKSQFGATLIHHALLDALTQNGVTLRSTYQIVSGGNMDFYNLQDSSRIQSKAASKKQGMFGADTKQSEQSSGDTHFGAEYIPFLSDRKTAFIRVEGTGFGGTPLEIDVRMSVEDSPSAAGNVLDAVRYMKYALDHGLGGVLDPAAVLLMKAPPRTMSEVDARAELAKLARED